MRARIVPGRAIWLAALVGGLVVSAGTARPAAPVEGALNRDVRGTVEDLGPQVFGSATHAVAFGQDPGGRWRAYVLQDGALDGGATPGVLNVVDVDSVRVEQSIPLPGSGGGWSVTVASDQSVLVGVYSSGEVFRHTPGDNQVVRLGPALRGETFVYGGAAGPQGAVFAGTFPGARVFRQMPGKGSEPIGPSPFVAPGEAPRSYVRTVAYDGERQVLYGGVGPGAGLTRHDLRTGATMEVLPAELRLEGEFPYAAKLVGDLMFLRLLRASEGVVLRLKAGEVAEIEARFPMMSLAFSDPSQGMIYYTHQAELCAFELATKKNRRLGAKWPANAYGMAVLSLSDQVRFPGESVVGVSVMSGRIWLARTCLQTGYTDSTPLAVPEIQQTLSAVVAGPGGRVYSSGYLTGGTGVYPWPENGVRPATLRGVAQAEGATVLGEKVYFGGYPGAMLYEYDPAQDWVEGSNPRLLFKLNDRLQDRPFGMSNDGDRRIFIGTAPEYGVLGGALTVFDAVTRTHETFTHEELGIPGLSVIATTYGAGRVYGGTSVSGGLGAEPARSEARLLEFDPETKRGKGIALPNEIPNRKAITALVLGPDAKLWMMVEGWLVIYDPAVAQFEPIANLFPNVVYTPSAASARLQDASLVVGRDGWVYGTSQGRVLFKLHPSTRERITLSATEGGTGLIADRAGDLYFHRGSRLFRYRP